MERHRSGVAIVCVVAVGVAATVAAGRTSGSSTTCTATQKAQHVQALHSYEKRAPALRRAYFRTHRSAKAKAAFVKQQQTKLAALRRAASCMVPAAKAPPPLAPSST